MEQTTLEHSKTERRRREAVSTCLRAHRSAVAAAYAKAFLHSARWQDAASAAHSEDFIAQHFLVFADYLQRHFTCQDNTYRDLLIGEEIKGLYEPALADLPEPGRIRIVLAEQVDGIEAAVRSHLNEAAWQVLMQFLAQIEETLTAEPACTRRVLLVGDCVFLDIVSFLVPALLAEGVRLIPTFATSQLGPMLREEIRRLADKPFDLVFYSPFSYEFAAEYTSLGKLSRVASSRAEAHAVAARTWDDTRATLEALAYTFDCPIHVHNSSGMVHTESTLTRVVKLKVTHRPRNVARDWLNDALEGYLRKKQAEGEFRLVLLDEKQRVHAFGLLRAGAALYWSAFQHPTAFGKVLSPAYQDVIVVNARLVGRKVLVCDLDNTLWEGVIGEGSVTHFHDRQRTLLKLKSRGVVLAIASKNDPSKVTFEGASVSAQDFVAQAISWEPKVFGVQRIQSGLNIKYGDFVFLDDRQDELALMASAYPAMQCLDATRAETWRRLEVWAEALDPNPDMDRTKMYQDREQRRAFSEMQQTSADERSRLFAQLDLRLQLSFARPADAARVSELINRTNQFNLSASRTTLKQVNEWQKSKDHLIVLGRSSDQFGDMGTTCIAVGQVEGARLRILAFVLSCRVFGYGVEFGTLAFLAQQAHRRGLESLVGNYVATPHNAPCALFLSEAGFVDDGAEWRLPLTRSEHIPVPAWLKLELTASA